MQLAGLVFILQAGVFLGRNHFNEVGWIEAESENYPEKQTKCKNGRYLTVTMTLPEAASESENGLKT